MSDQPNSGNNNNKPSPNNNRNAPNARRSPQAGGPPKPSQNQAPQKTDGNNGPRRRPNRNNNNRPRNPNQGPNPNAGTHSQSNGPAGINIERIYEKYLNLLDQHLIARRKYHDLFYRADPGQKNKLERNFYNTLADIRDFEGKLAPEARELFEKRNNGLSQDNIYTTNHAIPIIGDNPPPQSEWADPHFLQSQKLANYVDDKEESAGTPEDYLKYKNF